MPTAYASQDSVVQRLSEALGMDMGPKEGLDAGVSFAAYEPYAEAIRLLSANRGERAGCFVLTQEALGRVIACLQSALKVEPDFAAARYLLSLVEARERRYAEALAHYRAAGRLNSSFSEGPLKDLFVRAVADYQTAVQHIAQGTQYLERGKYTVAMSEYRQAIRLLPDFAEGHANLGLVYMLTGDYAQAVSEQQEAIRLKPDLAEAHYNLGNVYARQGRYAEAVGAYREAIRLKPDDAPPDSIVEEIYAHQGAYTESIARRQIAVRHASLANAYFKVGDHTAAISEYERVLKIEPDFADVHYNLGLIYEQVGDVDRAVSHWETYLNLAERDTSQRTWIPEAKARLSELKGRQKK